jgi:hypothetical protein
VKEASQNRQESRFSKLSFHKLDWLEYISLGLGIWFLLYPKPYEILFTILLCMPILGLLLNGINGRPSIASLVEITKEDGRNKYDVADFINFPAFIILIRVLLDFKFESFYSLVIPGTIAFVMMLMVLFLTHKVIEKSTKNKTWIYLSLLFNVLLYSYAGTYAANCVYDHSEPSVYQAEVIGKSIETSGRGGKSYYVTVTPWGHRSDLEGISVSRVQYEKIQIGQTVNIDLKQGLLNIPWFYIEQNN